MRPDEIRDLFDRELREHARPDGPGVRVERAGPVVRQVGGPDDWNGVLWSEPGLGAAGADAAITAQIAYWGGLGHAEFEWKLYSHDGPADLGERLRAGGFSAEPSETLLAAPVEALTALPGAEPPEGVELRPVTDAAGVELMALAHERAFGTDAGRLRHQVLTRLERAPDGFVALVALAGGEPVGSARMELYPGTGFAGLWGGGTVAEWRGRGLYRALVAHRARIAAERGYRFLQVDATDMSAPILVRLGFAALGTTTPYVYRAAR
ncbi:GNAT family N-acetyltransferase [Streptomyces griseus]|uniref:GNAT family N-acetyltransferase n=1 Tax=Streptomyces TaxID=1883 RepID=UPI0001C18CE4|nr:MULTISPECIES: GNAT family N-acetyltransferase [Streptomyces]EGE40658.1 GCN5-related N-acetyltransferase [Streptomyces sp. ACT-1]MYR48736.1 GNAT family N-acetyltransferase [Streptomyces sp. SID4928]MYT77666.1 GNAT family N-acetyltransferase [Streptomyces sp. SID8364]SBU90374.1 Predicted acetyltransferase [Streptomyces sp. MnatMP-M77]